MFTTFAQPWLRASHLLPPRSGFRSSVPNYRPPDGFGPFPLNMLGGRPKLDETGRREETCSGVGPTFFCRRNPTSNVRPKARFEVPFPTTPTSPAVFIGTGGADPPRRRGPILCGWAQVSGAGACSRRPNAGPVDVCPTPAFGFPPKPPKSRATFFVPFIAAWGLPQSAGGPCPPRPARSCPAPPQSANAFGAGLGRPGRLMPAPPRRPLFPAPPHPRLREKIPGRNGPWPVPTTRPPRAGQAYKKSGPVAKTKPRPARDLSPPAPRPRATQERPNRRCLTTDPGCGCDKSPFPRPDRPPGFFGARGLNSPRRPTFPVARPQCRRSLPANPRPVPPITEKGAEPGRQTAASPGRGAPSRVCFSAFLLFPFLSWPRPPSSPRGGQPARPNAPAPPQTYAKKKKNNRLPLSAFAPFPALRRPPDNRPPGQARLVRVGIPRPKFSLGPDDKATKRRSKPGFPTRVAQQPYRQFFLSLSQPREQNNAKRPLQNAGTRTEARPRPPPNIGLLTDFSDWKPRAGGRFQNENFYGPAGHMMAPFEPGPVQSLHRPTLGPFRPLFLTPTQSPLLRNLRRPQTSPPRGPPPLAPWSETPPDDGKRVRRPGFRGPSRRSRKKQTPSFERTTPGPPGLGPSKRLFLPYATRPGPFEVITPLFFSRFDPPCRPRPLCPD